jgi:hypothetical protein
MVYVIDARALAPDISSHNIGALGFRIVAYASLPGMCACWF